MNRDVISLAKWADYFLPVYKDHMTLICLDWIKPRRYIVLSPQASSRAILNTRTGSGMSVYFRVRATSSLVGTKMVTTNILCLLFTLTTNAHHAYILKVTVILIQTLNRLNNDLFKCTTQCTSN